MEEEEEEEETRQSESTNQNAPFRFKWTNERSAQARAVSLRKCMEEERKKAF